MKHASETLATIPDLLLKHPDETLATYVTKQLKHSKHTYETLKKLLKTLSYM